MSEHTAKTVVQQTLEVKIIRADGTVEDLGVVAYYHKNPLRRFLYRLRRRTGRIVHTEN